MYFIPNGERVTSWLCLEIISQNSPQYRPYVTLSNIHSHSPTLSSRDMRVNFALIPPLDSDGCGCYGISENGTWT